MPDDSNQLPQTSRLPADAERLGLTPLTAPELQVASALRSDRRRDKVLALIALVVVAAIVVVPVVTALTR